MPSAPVRDVVGAQPITPPLSSLSPPCSPERAASYVLLEQDAPDSDQDSDLGLAPRRARPRYASRDTLPSPATAQRRRTRSGLSSTARVRAERPRGWLLLPLAAVGDAVAVAALAFHTWLYEARGGTDASARLTTRLLLLLTLAAVMRDTVLGTLGSARSPRRFAPTVAATSLLSIIFSLGTLNLVLLAQSPHDLPRPTPGQPAPSAPVLRGRQRKGIALVASASLTSALFQWALHVVLAGVPLPPGGVGALHARRWLQDLGRGPPPTSVRSRRIIVPFSPATQQGEARTEDVPPLRLSQHSPTLVGEANERTHLLPPPGLATPTPTYTHGAPPPHGDSSPDSSVSDLQEAAERDAEQDELSEEDHIQGPDPDLDPEPGHEHEHEHDPADTEDEWDADEIVDIVPDRRVGKKLSAQRLALALADDHDPAHWRASYMLPPAPSNSRGHKHRARTLPSRPAQPFPHTAALRGALGNAGATARPTSASVRSGSGSWSSTPLLSVDRDGRDDAGPGRKRTASAAPALTLPEEA